MTCSGLANRAQSEMLPGLLVRVSAGETRAFAELHTMTRGRLRRIALAVGTAPHDADDVLQESFLKIWRNAARFDPGRASAMTWMAAIVRHTAIDHLRTRRQPSVELDKALTIPATAELSPTEHFDYASAEPIALGALARLPEDRRRLVALAYLEGESRASLSQRFGVPVGTIKTWLHRTILSVRKDCLSASAAA
ncbi:sigma-70 family RNA polymerase sigma factor [Bradyrhizobium diazoefficiens]|uniref:RNA polymerase sigma factor n=1 Tax=Bradyrhizobium sp. WYCCWR 12699 TaxID=3064203 RepID=UPI001BADDF41|nr:MULTISPECIES: sigma-70 family RNA polymerase sigma factor [Bradyrhizobium]MBR0928966.1 sigma-70 family RNA polymerase sigma factor [Bradyrhizobium diazoefficiens]MDT4737100.1 sigma-70 family RNA polymerase sigma factor [Bradyrhizobium sp. WYCCWR 12699]